MTAASMVRVAALAAFVAASSILNPPISGAQAKTGSINTHFSNPDDALKGRPVMISALQGGTVVDQQETRIPYDVRLSHITPGVYDVRAEGDGMVTEVKRGVHVFPGRELDLSFVVKSGKGAHVVEYATGGLSREEVAARLGKLETAVQELRATQPKQP